MTIAVSQLGRYRETQKSPNALRIFLGVTANSRKKANSIVLSPTLLFSLILCKKYIGTYTCSCFAHHGATEKGTSIPRVK